MYVYCDKVPKHKQRQGIHGAAGEAQAATGPQVEALSQQSPLIRSVLGCARAFSRALTSLCAHAKPQHRSLEHS